jgi:predicted nucleotidyltransferase
VRARRRDIERIAAVHGVVDVRVFGSVARGDARPDSDIDLLVEMAPGRSLLDMGAFLVDVEQLLGRAVDVITAAGLRARIRERVLREALPL